MAMKIYLETRGTARSAGYRFLGTEPKNAWWGDYGRFTAFEYPTILVESDANEWRVFLSGIPSNRVDATGTTNRCTIVIESAHPAGEDTELVVRLVSTWLGDNTDQRSEVSLQHVLDAEFPDEVVAQFYEQHGEETQRKVADKVQQALQALKMPVEPIKSADSMSSWIAPVRAEEGRAGFVDRVRTLLDGNQGRAILVNLTSDPRAFGPARPPKGNLVVLAVDETKKLENKLTDLPETESAKKAPWPPARRPRAQGRSGSTITKTRYIALAALVALVGVTVWIIIRWVME